MYSLNRAYLEGWHLGFIRLLHLSGWEKGTGEKS